MKGGVRSRGHRERGGPCLYKINLRRYIVKKRGGKMKISLRLNCVLRFVLALLLMPSLAFLPAAAPAAQVTIHIQEWDVPTPNSLPHDPAVAPDGSLWY